MSEYNLITYNPDEAMSETGQSSNLQSKLNPVVVYFVSSPLYKLIVLENSQSILFEVKVKPLDLEIEANLEFVLMSSLSGRKRNSLIPISI